MTDWVSEMKEEEEFQRASSILGGGQYLAFKQEKEQMCRKVVELSWFITSLYYPQHFLYLLTHPSRTTTT